MSDSILIRLRHHAKDERNTAFARSTMREADGEIERLRVCLSKANEQAEHFEREWYLRGDELEQLRAELAASRHELEGAKKAANAQARLIDSLEQQRAHLNAQRDQWIEARDTLDSERAANARLTEELAASRECEARMRALAESAIKTRSRDVSDWADDMRRIAALAEGAQG